MAFHEFTGPLQSCHPERSCRGRSARQRSRRTPMVQSPPRRRREFSPSSRKNASKLPDQAWRY